MPIGTIPGLFKGASYGIDVTDKDSMFREALTQNVTRAAGTVSFVVGHTQTGGIFNLSNGTLGSVLKLAATADAEETSIILLDLGSLVTVRNTLLNFTLNTNVGADDTARMHFEYSPDNATWTTILDKTDTQTADAITYDAFIAAATYRYLKITVVTDGNAANYVSLNELLLVI